MKAIYDLVLLSIKNVEIELDEYKIDEDQYIKKRLLNDLLLYLHEVRINIEKFLKEYDNLTKDAFNE
ncbi:hypothetical protein [Aliarcobacter butzleri]|uniref:hypothetical protein n=1 Tax=Aliarcobacter butzleri TaxID=28197 RepID=UPI0002295722|nr:hypothetical protein [Aliarcobacter butzleri]BAK70535.1 conserved hypothetical protein [Aliarcobacter butzleri ED-1]